MIKIKLYSYNRTGRRVCDEQQNKEKQNNYSENCVKHFDDRNSLEEQKRCLRVRKSSPSRGGRIKTKEE